MPASSLPSRTVALVGVGHANAHVVKQWRTNAPPDARLVCVSDQPLAAYSGMLPGVLAGQYQPSQMQIDLV
ncbi:MAG: NADH dehydrogenase subunit, partial [Planctomycetota bacterium]